MASIAAWADGQLEIAEVYVFGCRAEGTSSPDADLDIAIAVTALPGLTNKHTYEQNMLAWDRALESLLFPIIVDMRRYSPEAPRTFEAVATAGIRVYCRA